MNKTLHIVSLNIPWPANYGGVIDIFYKLKALHSCGVKIILHCFEYERPRTEKLDKFCKKVYYYKRKTGILHNLSYLPYNAYSRKDKDLIQNLLKDDSPILFEGLHTCYYIQDKRLSGRIKIFRSCNIEHDYYKEIALAENNWGKKAFHYIESIRFKFFEKKVGCADFILAVSRTDADHFSKTFPNTKVEFIPCFHENDKVVSVSGNSDFLLYHGKLSVKENEKAALYLIENVFKNLPYKCIIAGMNPSAKLVKAASYHPNIKIEANPSTERMVQLTKKAQINVLVTFQGTGLKLKLLNSLFAGRHVVANSLILTGSGLNELCHVSDNPQELTAICQQLMIKDFDEKAINEREARLFPFYSNKHQAQKIIQLIYGE